MDLNNSATLKKSAATRTSLACLPCRSRHLKCDSKRPQCSRCAESAKECYYAKSRRGGLDRARLAERRKQIAAVREEISAVVEPAHSLPNLLQSSFGISHNHADSMESSSTSHSYSPSGRNDESYVPPGDGIPFTLQCSSFSVEDDPLIETYYSQFHKLHPFVLPQKSLENLSHDSRFQLDIKPLIAVLRFIGHLYRSQNWSNSLDEAVEVAFSNVSQATPFMVQSHLLYSIALFWHGRKEKSSREMDVAIQLALELKMYLREFVAEYELEDLIMAESWRRTWWMLYIVDAYYVGTLGTMKFAFTDIDPTVDLPCEESEYESGDIPDPRSLHEFDCREFAENDTMFSSFAYLIGAVRCASSAMTSAPEVSTEGASPQLIQAADSVIEGWLLLLPKNQKQVMNKSGEIDELMFQAHLLIHVATIGLHRPLSDLKFNAIEDVSSCARDPPPEVPTPELVNVHTVRVMKSVEAQVRLLALPSRPFNHTPFTTCMLSEGTLALLSACKFILTGRKLAIARDQIRMTIGCLKSLGQVWPRTAKNVHEIQIIARHALQLDNNSPSTDTIRSKEVPSLSDSDRYASTGTESESATLTSDSVAAFGNTDNICGWYDIGDLGPDLSWLANDLSYEV